MTAPDLIEEIGAVFEEFSPAQPEGLREIGPNGEEIDEID